MQVKFHPEADIELHKAIEWYAHKKLNLDSEFMYCVGEAISKIQRNPKMFPVALKNARKVMVRKFPYTIYYEIGREKIMILAVFHSKRDPEDWQTRV